MSRAMWKGAIAFGLVHVPVAMYPASREDEIDFDWLDKRTMDPVGYKRVNKRTGKEIDKDDIVKGVQQDDGSYVVLSEDEVRQAYPKTTQTIEIQDFVRADEISFVYIEKPYYLEPSGRADKVYALLREAMSDQQLVGIARIVIRTKEHLAALLPAGPALMLGILRWADEIRPADDLKLPEGKAQIKDAELKMARQLIDEMTTKWDPTRYDNRFLHAIQKLVKAKIEAGEAQAVEPLEEVPSYGEDNVIDLTDLLKKSLDRKPPKKAEPARKPSREREHAAAKGGSRKRA